MAISSTSRGTGTNTTSSTSVAISPATNFTTTLPRAIAVLLIAYDNSMPSGADPYSQTTDSHGNNWFTAINSIGAATQNNGVVLRMLYSRMEVAQLTTASVITIVFSAPCGNKAYGVYEIATSLSGHQLGVIDSNSSTGTALTGTVTITANNSTNMVVGLFCGKGNATITADADTTSGSWSTQITATTAGGTAAVQFASQTKSVTASGSQSYDPTLSSSELFTSALIEIQETQDIIHPFGSTGFFGT